MAQDGDESSIVEEEIKKPMLYQKAHPKPRLEMIDSESDSDDD